jgi:hypothetical protein
MPMSGKANRSLEALPLLHDALAEQITSSIDDEIGEVQSVTYMLGSILLELRRIRMGMSMMVDEDLAALDMDQDTDV